MINNHKPTIKLNNANDANNNANNNDTKLGEWKIELVSKIIVYNFRKNSTSIKTSIKGSEFTQESAASLY